MIIGIGTDILDIRRFGTVMAEHEERFLQRSFTAIERALYEKRKPGGTHIATLAKRFAAKEACAKAFGTGFGADIAMHEIGVINDPSGAPALALTGGAKEKLQSLTPNGHTPHIHLSLTDEPPLVQAFVVIEARL